MKKLLIRVFSIFDKYNYEKRLTKKYENAAIAELSCMGT